MKTSAAPDTMDLVVERLSELVIVAVATGNHRNPTELIDAVRGKNSPKGTFTVIKAVVEALEGAGRIYRTPNGYRTRRYP